MSIQYQVHSYLGDVERQDLRDRITQEGWGAQFLSKQFSDGHWGLKFYQPKWTSSHYTLVDIRNLCISPNNELIKKAIFKIVSECKANDDGIYPKAKISHVCINGMF